jgi:HEAT repeat protein
VFREFSSRVNVVRKVLVVFVLACWPLSACAADVSELIKKLGSKDNEVRRSAAKELSELGKEATPAIRALTTALKDSDRYVRRFAAQALGSIGPDAKNSIKALAALLNDDGKGVREAAVKALANMGPAAVPVLSRAIKDASSDVQEVAIPALGKAGPEGLPPLINVIKDVKINASMRQMAITYVVKMGKEGHSAVPALAGVVKAPKGVGDVGRLRIDAINALGTLATKEDSTAISVLDNIVKDEKIRNNQLKNACRQALKKINERS